MTLPCLFVEASRHSDLILFNFMLILSENTFICIAYGYPQTVNHAFEDIQHIDNQPISTSNQTKIA